MLKQSLAAAATVAIISISAIGATTSSAQAGAKFHLHVGTPYWGGGYYEPRYYGNPCRHWKRKFHRTGRHRFLRKYRRCMRWYY